MSQHDFTPEEQAAIKADAAQRFGSAERYKIVDLADPIDATVVVAPFDLKSWAIHVDACSHDLGTAHAQALAARLLYPSQAEILDLRALWPTVPKHVCIRLHELAGQVPGVSPLCRLLTASTRPLALSQAAMDQLVAAHPGARLFAVEMPANGLCVVMSQPLPDVFLAAEAAEKDAQREGKGSVMAQLSWVRETIVWSATPIEAFLDQKPAAIADLWAGYRLMGGEGTATRVRSF